MLPKLAEASTHQDAVITRPERGPRPALRGAKPGYATRAAFARVGVVKRHARKKVRALGWEGRGICFWLLVPVRPPLGAAGRVPFITAPGSAEDHPIRPATQRDLYFDLLSERFLEQSIRPQNMNPASTTPRVCLVFVPSGPNANPDVTLRASTTERSPRRKKPLFW